MKTFSQIDCLPQISEILLIDDPHRVLSEFLLLTRTFFLQVLNLLKEGECESFDTMSLLRNLGQVRTNLVDVEDGNIQSSHFQEEEDLSKFKGTC